MALSVKEVIALPEEVIEERLGVEAGSGVTIEILGDPRTLKALSASRRDFRSGRTHEHGEVWRDG